MAVKSSVVPRYQPHSMYRGGSMEGKSRSTECKYAATYKFGKAIVHVVAPPPMTEEKKNSILREFYDAAWEAWDSIPEEERLRINSECEKIAPAAQKRGQERK